MTPAGEILAAEIRAQGPVPFSRFMDVALYDPEHGYYRRARDPFGKEGDFFTASQLQPVFGRLLACAMRGMRASQGDPEEFRVVEWGAGRGELAEALGEFRYAGVDVGRGAAPERMSGVVFCNELFDALPVDVARVRGGRTECMRVAVAGDGFEWIEGEEPAEAWRAYVERLAARFETRDELWVELPVRMRGTLEVMAAPLESGCIVAIDYGYTEREVVRYPRGTLMSYRKHRAVEEVLRDPGMQDITSHVPFTHLSECAVALGLAPRPLESMARFLLRAGEADQFAGALEAANEADAQRLRLQLKTLLFGLGETFRCMTLAR